ncbi:hypothetical protein EAN97_27035 [Klebsiella pneumoniae]|nr:hypothetical protein EAN97_27035 [Klebsiella pneumoniae]
MHVVSRYTAAEAAATIDPRGRAIALSVVIAAGALLLIMPPVIGVTGTLSLLTALIAAFGVGWGFTRGQSGFIAHPGGDALGLSAVSGRLAAGAGDLVWRAGLAGTAAGRGVRWGGSGCRLAHCGG